MANLHQKFCSENSNQTLSKAQFFRLRPFWIIRPKVTDRDTCACKLHENFSLKIKKLHQLGVIDMSSTGDVVQSSVCDTNNIACMYDRCQHCKGKFFPTTLDPLTKGNIVTWQEWVTQSVSVVKKAKDGSEEEKEIKNTFLETRNSSIEKLVALTFEHLPNFAAHIFNIRHQFLTLKSLKDTLHDTDVVVHIDYSENYSCKYSREIKETHFGGGNQQVTPGYSTPGYSTSAEAGWRHLRPFQPVCDMMQLLHGLIWIRF